MFPASLRNRFVSRTFSALRHRNYRLYFSGQVFSLIGTWMQIVAVGWLVLRITNSPLLLGVVTAMETLPSLFFSLVAGSIADLFDKRRIAIVTQSLAAAQALALGVLVATNHATFWNIFWLALFAGMINAFDLPVRQSLIFDIVGTEDLLNASALNSVVFNIARVIGPAIAAAIIEGYGETANFFANAASYAFVVAALIAMRTEPVVSRSDAHVLLFRHALDGLAYVARHPLLSRLFLALVIYSIFGFNYVLLMPVVVKLELHRSAGALGLLLSCLGAGALFGSLTLAARGRGRFSSLSAMSFIFPASIIAFSLARNLVAAAVLVAFLGFAMVQFVVRFTTFLQTEAGDEMRGRVLGLYNMVLMGLSPLGALQAGALAERLGASTTLAIGGDICIPASFWLWMTRPSRRQQVAAQPAQRLTAK
ncbi:MAG: MFS transporter [Candidatus Eremiobacteraeota bacterium]|nr:MFS transporter [Candidatus Eremiobacteraeota bacterium]